MLFRSVRASIRGRSSARAATTIRLVDDGTCVKRPAKSATVGVSMSSETPASRLLISSVVELPGSTEISTYPVVSPEKSTATRLFAAGAARRPQWRIS